MKAPSDLEPTTRRWWLRYVAEYDLEPHHKDLLTLAGRFWDRGTKANAILDELGLTYLDRFGQPRARPEVAIARDSAIGYARMIRELAFDVSEPAESRPPMIMGRRTG